MKMKADKAVYQKIHIPVGVLKKIIFHEIMVVQISV